MAGWKSIRAPRMESKCAEKYPRNPKEGHWWLLGTNEDDSAYYLDDRTRETHHIRRQNEEFSVLCTEKIPENKSVYEYIEIKKSPNNKIWDDPSQYSWPFTLASGIRGTGHLLSAEQAVVYSFREICGIPRQDTAAVLGKSPNTIDNQLSDAKRKVQWADSLVELLNDYRGIEET